MKKLSKKTLNDFAKEEAAASKLYKKYGLDSFAKDEARHARFFKMMGKRK